MVSALCANSRPLPAFFTATRTLSASDSDLTSNNARGRVASAAAPSGKTRPARQRSVAKNARTSSTNSCGCSNAAKCPPRGMAVQWVMW